jgi:hypothetical protein
MCRGEIAVRSHRDRVHRNGCLRTTGMADRVDWNAHLQQLPQGFVQRRRVQIGPPLTWRCIKTT